MRLIKDLCIFLVVVFVLSVTVPSKAATVNASIPENVKESTSTINQDFEDDKVIVCLNNTASLECISSGCPNFTEISYKNIVNLTSSTTALMEVKLNEAKTTSLQAAGTNTTISSNNISIKEKDFNQILCITLAEPGKANVIRAIKALESRDDVLYAEPNYYLHTESVVPSDYFFSDQWGSSKIALPQAWEISTGSSSVYVGIVDSGIEGTHPDLASRVNIALSRNCGSGMPTAVTNLFDSGINGHGTHVAGIVGAAGNNSIGITGTNWNVSLVSLQITPHQTGISTIDAAVAAIDYARGTLQDGVSGNNIRILNISYGYYGVNNQEETSSLYTAIENYGDAGGLVVCSAGNCGIDINDASHYPSCLTDEFDFVISVGASTANDTLMFDSNYGSTAVDLFAPGENILSCFPIEQCGIEGLDVDEHYAEGYHYKSGTSMAAPYVTGVAALMLADNSSLTASSIKQILNSTVDGAADGVNAFTNKCVSGGRLNAYKAIQASHVHRYIYTCTSSHHSAACRCGATISPQAHRWMELDGITICRICGYAP